MKLRRLLTLTALALTVGSTLADERQLAFPGAEGYGRYATGGRGGKVYVVTSLDDCAENNLKEGTFRWAVKQPGKKIVTFAVNGTIYLTSALNLDCGDLTILGQTAPGEGVCLADYPVTISCENAIIRYMRFRLGNRQVAYHEGDGFGFNGANNVIMDHCSVSWSIDECLSISAATNLTIQWCMVEQALNNAGHSKGAHGYGGNWGGTNVTFHHNLIAQCTSRVPRLGGDTSPETNDFCDLRNNVFYNWGGNGCYGAEGIDVNFVNNYYKPGPCTDTRGEKIRYRICGIGIRTKDYITNVSPAFAHDLHKWGHFYVDGNVNPDYPNVTKDNWTYGIVQQVDGSAQDGTWTAVTRDTIHLKEPHEFAHVTTHTAEEAYDMVLKYAGASLHRDCVDDLIASQAELRLGEENSGSNGAKWGQIDRQSDNNLSASLVENDAWPILKDLTQTRRDTDKDGIPDVFEESWELDINDPTDGAQYYQGTNQNLIGYSYIEGYVNRSNATIRDWNAHCTEGGQVMGVDEPTIVCLRRMPWEHEISQLTFKGFDKKSQRQLYADGLSMNATNGISGGTGVNQTLKLRAQQYTINVPATMKVKSVRIVGYANYSNDIHVTEIAGQKLQSGQYKINGKDKPTETIVIPLNEELSGKPLTITFSGDSQPCLRIYLQEEPDTQAVEAVKTDDGEWHAGPIYDMQGRPASASAKKGLYIIGGKKVVLR